MDSIDDDNADVFDTEGVVLVFFGSRRRLWCGNSISPWSRRL